MEILIMEDLIKLTILYYYTDYEIQEEGTLSQKEWLEEKISQWRKGRICDRLGL